MATVGKPRGRGPRGRQPKQSVGISLPTECNVPPKELTSYCIMLYGEKGIGKTSLAAQFPNLTTLMWEPLRKNLKNKQIPQKGELPLTWSRLKEYVPLLIEQKTPVSIDTVDRCYQACLEYHCMMHPDQPTTPHGMEDWGKLWSEIKVDFEKTINQLLYSEAVPMFVSHGRYREFKTLTGEVDNEQVIPTAPNAAFEYMKAVCDLVMYYGYIGRKRTLTIRGSDAVFASCGMEDYFQTRDGESIITFNAGNSAKEAYDRLIRAFNNTLDPKLVLGKGEAYENEEQIEEDEEKTITTKPKKKGVTRPKKKKT